MDNGTWLALQTAVLARPFLSVYPSFPRILTNEDTIVRFSASGRTIPLVSGEVKFIRIFAGITPSEGVKVKRLPIASDIWHTKLNLTLTLTVNSYQQVSRFGTDSLGNVLWVNVQGPICEKNILGKFLKLSLLLLKFVLKVCRKLRS